MAIVILNRSAMSFSPYHEWFSKTKESLHYFSAMGKRDLNSVQQAEADKHYDTIKEYADYDTSSQIEQDIYSLNKTEKISSIVAMSEWDVMRAARVRATLGLKGQSEESAAAFRDKLLMKQLLQKAGIPLVAFSSVKTTQDLMSFAHEICLPILIKPRWSAGSRGLKIFRNLSDIKNFTLDSDDLISEKLLNYKNEYHVDGIIVEGKLKLVWPSVYLGKPMDYDGISFFGGITLEKTHYQLQPLQNLIARTLKALPCPITTTFHAEVFEKENGELVLNEIASRTGGFRVNDIIKPTFGFWLNREWARSMANLPIDEPEEGIPVVPNGVAGYVMLRPRAGRLVSIPTHCNLEGIYDYRVSGRPGQVYKPAQSSGETIATAVVHGSSDDEVRKKLELVYNWFYENLETVN